MYSLIIFGALISVACSQSLQPYVRATTASKEHCLGEAGLTSAQLADLEKSDEKCLDKFAEDSELGKKARKYFYCLLQEADFYSEDDKFILDRLHTKWAQILNAGYVDKALSKCRKEITNDDKCDRAYFMMKCVDKSLGDYPHNTNIIAILDTTKAVEDQCKTKTGITDAQLCSAMLPSEDGKPKTPTELELRFHTCLIETLGFIKDNVWDRNAVRIRFSYEEDKDFDKVYEKCVVPITEADKYKTVYASHKCLKEGFEEYPINRNKFA